MRPARLSRIMTEEYEFNANTKEELVAIIENYINEKRMLYGKDNVKRSHFSRQYTKNLNGEIISWHEKGTITYLVPLKNESQNNQNIKNAHPDDFTR